MQQLVDSVYPEDGKVLAPYGGFAMETGDADGGWIATASDLVRFFISLEGKGLHEILTPALFKHMLLKPPYAKGSAWYGFGLEVSWYRKAWEHSGTLDGATSCLVRDRHGYTWAFLCNFWPPDSDYTSLISYALTRVSHLSKVKQVFIEPADISTLDKKYCVNIKVPMEDFESLSQAYRDIGYAACWVNGYEFKKNVLFNVIWTKNSYLVYHSVNDIELRELLDKHSSTHRVCHIDTYCNELTVKYAVIFTSDTTTKWKLKMFNNIEDQEFHTKILKEQGYHVTRQSATVIEGEATIAVLYEQIHHIDTTWSYMALTSEKYQSEFNRHSRYGHLITYVKPYRYENRSLFSTIWTSSGPYVYTSEYEMSACRLLNDLLYAFERKFYPVCIGGYEDDDAHKFVCVCLKKVPPNSVSWQKPKAVDESIKSLQPWVNREGSQDSLAGRDTRLICCPHTFQGMWICQLIGPWEMWR